MGNDIEIRVKVANQTGTGLTAVNNSLDTLKQRANAAATAVSNLRAVADDISITATVDNQTRSEFTEIENSISALRAISDIDIRVGVDDQTTAGLAQIRSTLDAFVAANRWDIEVGLDDQTTAGFTGILASLSAVQAAGRTDLEVRLDDQTTAGFATLATAIGDLRAESPIRLDVTFDDQSGQVSDTARAVRQLSTDARNAATNLTTLTAQALTGSVALLRLAAAAEDAKQELDGLRSAASRAATAVGRLGERADSTDDRLLHLRRTTLDLSGDLDLLGDSSRYAGDGLRDLRGGLGSLTTSAGNASASLGGSGMGLRGQLIGVAAVLGATLLPTIGAVAPMLTGLAVVGGGAALAMDDLKEKVKQLKGPFEDWKKAAEKGLAPHTERAVKSLKTAMKELTPTLQLGAETFGSITERASEFVASPAFQTAFQRNAKMGVVWVEEFAGSIGKFTQAFLEFGTKSKPALDAWQELLGGFLDTGLPGMFAGLEQGIGGASEMMSGFASFLNEGILPALGKISGSFAEAFGPLIGEMLEGTGLALRGLATGFEYAMELAEPFAGVFADAIRATNEVMRIGTEVAGSLASALGGALVESMLEVIGIDTSKMGNGFRGLSNWVSENEGRIRGAFYAIAEGITSMVTVGISMLPQLWGAFRLTTEAVLLAVDGMVSGMAKAFGHLPVIGDKFKEANSNFDTFAEGFRGTLDKVGGGINRFVEEAVPRLSRVQLKLRVDEAEQNLRSIKEKLEDPALTKERRAKLSAEKGEAEAKLAAAKRELAAFDRSRADATLAADPRPFFGDAARVRGTRFSKKNVPIDAATSAFWSAVGGISGSVVGSAYINVYNRYIDNKAAKPFRAFGGPVQRRANGGEIQHFPNGGYVEGPGGPRSDSILATFASGATAMVSDTEYVIQSSAVKKYGLPLLDALNRGTLKLAGGGVTKSEAKARKETSHLLSVSRFGQMAGWRDSEIRNALGDPGSIEALVSALSQWRSNIQKATHGTTEVRLLRQLDATAKRLFSYQKQLDKVNSSLQKSKDRLEELQRAASQLRESIQNGVLASANITRNRQDGPVTTASIMAQLTGSRDKASSFAKALESLRRRGLASSLIEQIAEAGIDGGGLETASALMKASMSEIMQMNKLQSQVLDSAIAAGKTTADAVYGLQIKGSQELVKYWSDAAKTLTKAMDKLAAAMEKSVEKAWSGKATGGSSAPRRAGPAARGRSSASTSRSWSACRSGPACTPGPTPAACSSRPGPPCSTPPARAPASTGPRRPHAPTSPS
ncbi:hypothetical protein DN402_31800 [Streptomyces sp. SW4]|nr:hypothetical protein DN402_31800 [Streptomyces sp. SW4]